MYVRRSSSKVRVTLVSCVLMGLELYRQIFEKLCDMKFRGNPLSGSGVVPCGQTDKRTERHYEANSRFSQFYERARKPVS
jgi:hypothetical protein